MTRENLLETLKNRFETNMQRHRSLTWDLVEEYFSNDPSLIKKVAGMEDTGGQPDVFVLEDGIYFIDSSKESPEGRRSLCYDQSARENRKIRPALSSVEEMCEDMELDLVNEKIYLLMQEVEDFDTKTTSWLKTEDDFRNKGSAIFANKHYGRTFFYYNQADSYFESRGFRAFVLIS